MDEQPPVGVVCPRGGPAHRVQKLNTVPVDPGSSLVCLADDGLVVSAVSSLFFAVGCFVSG